MRIQGWLSKWGATTNWCHILSIIYICIHTYLPTYIYIYIYMCFTYIYRANSIIYIPISIYVLSITQILTKSRTDKKKPPPSTATEGSAPRVTKWRRLGGIPHMWCLIFVSRRGWNNSIMRIQGWLSKWGATTNRCHILSIIYIYMYTYLSTYIYIYICFTYIYRVSPTIYIPISIYVLSITQILTKLHTGKETPHPSTATEGS